MKKAIFIFIIFLIGIGVGILANKEYEKFYPLSEPSGGSTSNENDVLNVTLFVSTPIQTFKGKVVQVKATVTNKSNEDLDLSSKKCKPILQFSQYYGEKKVEDSDHTCIQDEWIRLSKNASFWKTVVLPYDEKALKKYKSGKISVTVEGLTTEMGIH
ncbi:hypothetical protein BACCIP111895_01718 [Neobacillus rhizosphaerae]|uniref:DUF4352 domain-containing protein n=1 Tax=Neobacillus rhizosphaerae TaxID=2880965 RepID=A0ABN8KQ58_9BACI|nr:hypothetical protein [Neobacillus rhizosphaerae]CAH2714546.1 hypothetical protein BACCIP111895_01718 [Neobacillus rhizosphaerae]